MGISAKHLTAPTIQLGERQDFKIDMSYFLTAGYNIKLRNPFISIQPSLWARYDGTAYRVDMTGRVKYTHEKKVMYAGAA